MEVMIPNKVARFLWPTVYTVHFTAFCVGGPFFPGHGVHTYIDLILYSSSLR